MNDTVLIRPELAAPAASPLEALARRAVLRRLVGLGQGTLLIQEGGRLHRFGAGLPEARVLRLRRWASQRSGADSRAKPVSMPSTTARLRSSRRSRPVRSSLCQSPAM